jgi:hypothetical protein
MWPTIIAGAASLIGGLAGASEAKKGRESAEDAQRRAIELLQNVETPGIEEQKAILEELRVIGEYNPEALQSLGLDPSAMEQVSADPEVVQQQMDALKTMSEVAEGGYTEGDKAAMRDVKRDVNQNARARQKSILNEMAQRGVLGSGMELAAQLKGEQQSIDAEASASNKAIQNAQARALQATAQQSSMAGNLRSQDVGEQANIAKAKDAINQFNTANRQRVMGQNVASRNQAQAANLAARQAASDANIQNRNQNELRNKQLIQQQFQNDIQRAGGQAEQLTAGGKIAQAGHNAVAGQYAGIGGGIADIVSAFNKKDKKKDGES